MNNEEYQVGFDAGEDFAITNVESYLTNLSTDKLWSLFSAVQVELETRDDSFFDAPSSGDLTEEALQSLQRGIADAEVGRFVERVFPACGSFD